MYLVLTGTITFEMITDTRRKWWGIKGSSIINKPEPVF
ncbi:Uncharacterized protein dnl_21230 [Desulfonema limicola]|uniref:Uncharacterized protein n=1 Tax=Desulfonema limicola TaxID=45656 RepID=A0A975GG08_9BACT|nr:Uncharacterized protein dnl_21230 [Desulfonema limicola]